MRYGSLGQGSSATASDEPRAPGGATAAGVKEIPYDYVATFKLTGGRGARVQDVITISTEGTFVAVSVGYSFVPSPAAITAPGGVPGIQFLYTIVDSGSGRELQNKAVHNIAGLGSADGHRPFRPFARPVQFVPRSTIRIEIEEVADEPLFKDGTLFLVLHGYKRLGE